MLLFVTLFGVRLLGFNEATLRKLALTVGFFIGITLIASALRWLARLVTRGEEKRHLHFLSQQVVSILSSIAFVIIFVSIWLDNPARFAGSLALVTAGLTVALQKFVMSLVGYIAILRGNTFKVGDRITMGGIRGDVIALGYIRTTIMEMGEPPAVQAADPAMWVEARQYTGRIVTNDKIFDQPVYNFTRDFPYLFEEIKLPVRYQADHAKAEEILREAAEHHTVSIRELSEEQLQALRRRYFLRPAEIGPKVYWRLTDNWLELTVRFIVREYGIREVKDAMSREILSRLQEAKIDIASATFELVGAPPIRVVSAERP
jgi:small-conductance mechanosensitive channel